MTKLDDLTDKAWLEYIKRVKGNLPGPGTLFSHGFEDGYKARDEEIQIYKEAMQKIIIECTPSRAAGIAAYVGYALKDWKADE